MRLRQLRLRHNHLPICLVLVADRRLYDAHVLARLPDVGRNGPIVHNVLIYCEQPPSAFVEFQLVVIVGQERKRMNEILPHSAQHYHRLYSLDWLELWIDVLHAVELELPACPNIGIGGSLLLILFCDRLVNLILNIRDLQFAMLLMRVHVQVQLGHISLQGQVVIGTIVKTTKNVHKVPKLVSTAA